MASIKQLLAQVKTQVEAHAPLAGAFKDVTLAEFPYAEGFPALHINFEGEADEPGLPGIGFNLRTVRVGLYVTLAQKDLTSREGAINDLIEEVRNAIKADRTIGGMSNLHVRGLPVSKVPSPLGGAYVGTRRITFEAGLVEAI
jgi:hypothetical protein